VAYLRPAVYFAYLCVTWPNKNCVDQVVAIENVQSVFRLPEIGWHLAATRNFVVLSHV
jgi:hypothetical protein